MPTFNENFGFSSSPFEKYVAEREPDINSYAVTPPYYEEARRRIASRDSYLLFGFRGAGKSATRLTSEKETWNGERDSRQPLLVPFTDFEHLLRTKTPAQIEDIDLVLRTAFLTIEAILLWMSNQEEGEEYVEMLDEQEYRNLSQLAQAFYLSEPAAIREVSQAQAMALLHQSWSNIAGIWIGKRWGKISEIIGKLTSTLGQVKFGTNDISDQVSALLRNGEAAQSSRLIMQRLTEAAQAIGFSGIAVLVDKVDEHAKTQKSHTEAARIIYPIVSQVQLMEVDDFAWIFFLWDKIKSDFSHGELEVRLDKFPLSDIEWPEEFLKDLINKRVTFFSDGSLSGFSDICASSFDSDGELAEIIGLVQRSPRELIRLLDVISREFTSNHAATDERLQLTLDDINRGKDLYVRDILWTIYDGRVLSQLIRLNLSQFTNNDVKQAFRISGPGARGRIQSWEAAGAVGLTGTRAPEGDSGGKPANEYTVTDRRILRMAERNLYDPEKLSEPPIDTDE